MIHWTHLNDEGSSHQLEPYRHWRLSFLDFAVLVLVPLVAGLAVAGVLP